MKEKLRELVVGTALTEMLNTGDSSDRGNDRRESWLFGKEEQQQW